MVDLKPCPFCGGEAFAGTTLDHVCYVMCRSETCWSMVGYLPTEAEAIEAWNRRALSPAGTASEMEPVGWQPIETAPKDGTQVQVFCPTYFQGKGGITWAVWLNGGWLDAQVRRCDPTHWMPLPTPPKAGE